MFSLQADLEKSINSCYTLIKVKKRKEKNQFLMNYVVYLMSNHLLLI